jgi:hypothetical protein
VRNAEEKIRLYRQLACQLLQDAKQLAKKPTTSAETRASGTHIATHFTRIVAYANYVLEHRHEMERHAEAIKQMFAPPGALRRWPSRSSRLRQNRGRDLSLPDGKLAWAKAGRSHAARAVRSLTNASTTPTRAATRKRPSTRVARLERQGATQRGFAHLPDHGIRQPHRTPATSPAATTPSRSGSARISRGIASTAQSLRIRTPYIPARGRQLARLRA